MTERYADLRLYYGLCSSDGCGEGRFAASRELEWNTKHYDLVMSIVKKHLDGTLPYGLRFGYNPFVQNEKEAKMLLEYSEKNIKGASGLIQLLDSMHGEIGFLRNIRFDGWEESQLDQLLTELKGSGYIPQDRRREEMKSYLKSKDTPEDRLWNQQMQQRIDELDPDMPWKEALEFYPTKK
jgi:hypothetical protein